MLAAGFGAIALSAVAVPALAANDDINGSKVALDSGPFYDGDDVEYTIQTDNVSAAVQPNVTMLDTPDPGLVYVPGSTLAVVYNHTFDTVAQDPLDPSGPGSVHSEYNLGSGWSTNWVEAHDDGDGNTGAVRFEGGVDQFAIRLSGGTVAPSSAADALQNFPAIIRNVDPAALVGLDAAELSFQTNASNLDGSDKLGVWIARNGGPYVLQTELPNPAGPGFGLVNLDSLLPATSLSIRLGISAGTYAGPVGSEYFTVDDFLLTGVHSTSKYFDNNPVGLNNLADGTPAYLILTADNVDLEPQFSFHSSIWQSHLNVWYHMTVDVTAIEGWATSLENLGYWRSTTYDSDYFSTSMEDVDVIYAPVIDWTHDAVGPFNVGEPIIVTFVFQHDPSSDGSLVCPAGLFFPTSVTFLSVTGDTNGDECIDEGEVLTVVVRLPGFPTAGTFTINPEFVAWTANAFGDDPDVDMVEPFDVTVVLAATGPANASAAGISVALIAMGVGMLILVRRRTT